jgi:hypothetical protein
MHKLKFFYKVSRNTSENKLITYLENSWSEDALDTLKIIFYLRDCRGGKGEKLQSYRCYKWLANHHFDILYKNLHLLPEYGSYKDFLYLLGTEMELPALQYLVDQFVTDIILYNENKKISLVAKWLPTEGSSFDRKYDVVNKICSLLSITKMEYRKFWLVPLRKHLNIIEHKICIGQWDQIDLNQIPYIARKKYKNKIISYSPKSYNDYLVNIKKRKTIIEDISFWDDCITNLKSQTHLTNMLACIDIVGSPQIILTLLIAELNQGVFHNKYITNSKIYNIEGNTLYEKIDNMRKQIGRNTNIIIKEQTPESIVVFTDHYDFPEFSVPNQFIWNIMNDKIEFLSESPILIGGYSQEMIELFLEGKLNRINYMMKIINGKRYKDIKIN